jgi:hypothetical protein
LSTKTKSAFKTTELMAYLGSVVAILTAAQTIGDESSAGDGGDCFRADKAFLYTTIVTVGYLLSHGMAKSGSRDFYDDEQSHRSAEPPSHWDGGSACRPGIDPLMASLTSRDRHGPGRACIIMMHGYTVQNLCGVSEVHDVSLAGFAILE